MKVALASLLVPLAAVALASTSPAQTTTKVPATLGPGAQPFTGLANLNLAASTVTVGDDLLAFQVSEADQAGVDRNGDGDVSDHVMHVWDARTDTVTNVGVASVAWGGWPQAQGRRAWFVVYETDHGNTDLNGDGDAFDLVLHGYDVDTSTLVNLGLAVDSFQADGDLVAFLVPEGSQNADLNSDGDVSDKVLHVRDAQLGFTRNLGYTCDSSTHYELAGDVVAYLIDEQDQGGTDYNGDGDAWDAVLAIHLVSTNTTHHTAASAHPASPQLANDGTMVAVLVRESAQGADLNADGDTFDEVLHVVDPLTGIANNLGLAATELIVNGNLVAFQVVEYAQGASGTDYNLDGDVSDTVYHTYGGSPAALTNTARAGMQYSMDLDGGLLAFLVRESSDGGADHNGDGDTGDRVLFVLDVSSGAVTNVGLDGNQYPEVESGNVLFTAHEDRNGETDLNGDADWNDGVLHVYQAGPARLVNLGFATGPAGFQFAVDGTLVALRVIESAHGNTDLNGDGDKLDQVLHLYDVTRQHTWSAGLASDEPVVGGRFIGFLGMESQQGGADLNGDGDASDGVVHVVAH